MKIVFDVDGTLIKQDGSGRDVPRYDVIQLFHLFEKLTYQMYIWSGGGVEYAKTWADKLGLQAVIVPKFLFDNFTPDIIVDDGFEVEVPVGIALIKV